MWILVEESLVEGEGFVVFVVLRRCCGECVGVCVDKERRDA